MKYSPAQILALLRTPIGRSEIGVGLGFRAWPIYAAAARRHRRRLDGPRFVAVVGSFGKTTTARAVRAALGLDPQAHVASNSWTAVAQRVLGALQDQHARALAHHEAVAALVERRTRACRRERAQLRKTHLRVERARPREPAAEHRIRATGEQFVDRKFHGVQR